MPRHTHARAPEAGAAPLTSARGAEREVEFADQRLRFADGGELERIEALDASGAVLWTAEYATWREVPGGRYPFRVTLSFPKTQLRAELEVESRPAAQPVPVARCAARRRQPVRRRGNVPSAQLLCYQCGDEHGHP